MTEAGGALVPELSVGDLAASLAFYTGLLGFSCRYSRPEEGFAFLERAGAQIMLDQAGIGRDFDPGLSMSPRPWGRGMNLQIRVLAVEPLLAALSRAGWALSLPLEERWYRAGAEDLGNRQFVVADPDGYLLRFYEDLGRRPAQAS